MEKRPNHARVLEDNAMEGTEDHIVVRRSLFPKEGLVEGLGYDPHG